MLYRCVDGKEEAEDEGEAVNFLVGLHSYPHGWMDAYEDIILNLFYGYAFYKFTMLPKTAIICNCVTLTMCLLIHCICLSLHKIIKPK